MKVCKRPLVNEVLGLLLTESSPIRPTRARHLYSMDSKAAFSFASRFLELIRHGAALEIGAVAITVASFIYSARNAAGWPDLKCPKLLGSPIRLRGPSSLRGRDPRVVGR